MPLECFHSFGIRKVRLSAEERNELGGIAHVKTLFGNIVKQQVMKRECV